MKTKERKLEEILSLAKEKFTIGVRLYAMSNPSFMTDSPCFVDKDEFRICKNGIKVSTNQGFKYCYVNGKFRYV
jgi:hypothetical protein